MHDICLHVWPSRPQSLGQSVGRYFVGWLGENLLDVVIISELICEHLSNGNNNTETEEEYFSCIIWSMYHMHPFWIDGYCCAVVSFGTDLSPYVLEIIRLFFSFYLYIVYSPFICLLLSHNVSLFSSTPFDLYAERLCFLCVPIYKCQQTLLTYSMKHIRF